jgi:hypothetical protein
MSYELNIAEIDADGAIRETAAGAREALRADGVADGDTRLSFLRKAGVGGAALAASGGLVSALATPALAASAGHGRPPKSFGKGDIGILNYALTLEYLEAAFYNGAAAANLSLDPATAAFLKVVVKDENAHVAYLKKALGSKAAKKPTFDFKGTNTNVAMFKATSQVLENTGVHAYSGQALNIKSPKVVQAAVSILTIEARHASVIGLINDASGNSIAPDGPFDTPFTAAKVIAAVKGTGFIVGL